MNDDPVSVPSEEDNSAQVNVKAGITALRDAAVTPIRRMETSAAKGRGVTLHPNNVTDILNFIMFIQQMNEAMMNRVQELEEQVDELEKKRRLWRPRK